MSGIGDRYREVSERVAEAAIRSGRRPDSVTVIAAAKTFGADAVRDFLAAGGRHVGENYVQEARRKAESIGSTDLHWHFIGRLQRNKASAAVGLFGVIHTLDRLELGLELDRAGSRRGVRVRCLLEVNLEGEATKAGVRPDALPGLVDDIGRLDHLDVIGLMTIPPPGAADRGRGSFARLRGLGEQLSRLRPANVQFKELSMGMSADFEAAIEEGATMVRIGTSIFGPRNRS